ncbi:hypothetical protein Ancab_020426 [Ancistrocladus abbreviatus]
MFFRQFDVRAVRARGDEGGPSVLKAKCSLGESELGQATAKEVISPKEIGPAKRLQLAKVKPRRYNVCKTKSNRHKSSLKPKGSGSVKKEETVTRIGKVVRKWRFLVCLFGITTLKT